MDKIFLEGVELYAHGGVSASEREVGQRYRLDIICEVDVSRAACSDDVVDTVSYAHVYEIARNALCAGPFALLESRAVSIAEALLEKLAIEGVTVRLRKLNPPIPAVVEAAGVEVQRARS